MVNFCMNYVWFFVMYHKLSERCPSQMILSNLEREILPWTPNKIIIWQELLAYVLWFQLVAKLKFD